MTTRSTIIFTSNTTWVVPNTWNSSNNTVICVGAGAGGGSANGNQYGGGGGGGGARATSQNITLTPGSNVTITVGDGGAATVAGGDTSFDGGRVLAKGGSPGSNTAPGTGGSTASSNGDLLFAGGNGGRANTAATGLSSGGGGGAGGNTANGSNAPSGNSTAVGLGGSGAGGATAGGNSSPTVDLVYGDGANGEFGYDAGLNSWAQNLSGAGGSGSAGYDGTSYNGGNGGLYGGGAGGGSANGGRGAHGVVSVSWTWEDKVTASGEVQFSEIALAAKLPPQNQTSLGNTSIRSLVGVPSGEISFSNSYSDFVPASFVNAVSGSGSLTTIALPSGWQSGDVALLCVLSYANNIQATSNNWISLGTGAAAISNQSSGKLTAFSKVLSSSDGANITFTHTLGGAVILVFRDATTITPLAKTDSESGNNLTFASVTKDSGCKLLGTIVADRDSRDFVPPSGWSKVANASLSFGTIAAATINAISHTDGSTVQWANGGTSWQNFGFVFSVS